MVDARSRRSISTKTKVVFTAGVFAFALLTAEFGVRFLMPAGRLLSPTAIDTFYERAQTESTMIAAHPLLGHAPVLGGEYYDRFGLLRGWRTRSGDMRKEPGVRRVLMLGDSVTRRATILEPLRAIWGDDDVEVLNAGVESWNPIQEVASYQRLQRQLDADHVVLWLHNNDLTETTVACFDEGQLTLCNPGAFVPVDRAWYGRSILYQLYVHSRHTDRLNAEHYTFRVEQVEQALAALRDELRDRGVRLTIALLPIFSPQAEWQPHERRARQLELAMLDRLGLEWFDLQPALDELTAAGVPVRATPNDVFHPNDAAGAALARAAQRHLERAVAPADGPGDVSLHDAGGGRASARRRR